MEVTPDVAALGIRLGESAVRNTATLIQDRVRSLKQKSTDAETIAGMEEIISSLIADKSELDRIARAYQEELVAQRLAHGDVRYIAETVLPLLTKLGDGMEEQEAAKFKKQIANLTPLLSVETVNVLQILGFNFRRAIGEPLTTVVEQLILSQAGPSQEVQIEQLKAQQILMQLALEPEAMDRFHQM